jgi:hypothetical protein
MLRATAHTLIQSQTSIQFTPNTTASVSHTRLNKCTIIAMQKELKLSSYGGNYISKKGKQGYGRV